MTRIVVPFLALLFVSSHILAGPSSSPLADAVEKSDRDAIRKFLKQHADVNASQPDGMTALHWAVRLDNLETAQILVKNGANAAATNHYGVSPLSIACENGDSKMVELLLNTGADPNTTLRGGETVLMTAARTGKIEPVKALLAHGAKVDAKERHGQTALMWAAAEGNTEVVEELIKSGADFRTPLSVSGFTPLLFAVREGRAETVRALLKAGVDVNEVTHPNKPSARSPHKGTSPLIMAVENGHFELAVELLKAGADPNDQRSGFTALHVMTWVRKPARGEGVEGEPPPLGSGNLTSLQFVRKLVEHGADVNARLKHGASGEGILNRTGASPFLLAAFTDDLPLMRLLIELGADPKLKNADNTTPLITAAGIGVGNSAANETAGTEPEALEAVKYLLELGNDINAVDNNGETAMHGAAYKNFPRVIELLAAKGAKIEIWNQKNKYGWTPLMIAQGHRPGNFKPSFETVEAIERLMRAGGALPTTNTTSASRQNYQ